MNEVPLSGDYNDFRVNWKYIVDKMASAGISQESTELHEFGYFKNKLTQIWNEYVDSMYLSYGETIQNETN